MKKLLLFALLVSSVSFIGCHKKTDDEATTPSSTVAPAPVAPAPVAPAPVADSPAPVAPATPESK